MKYIDFLETKQKKVSNLGFDADLSQSKLFDFQKHVVQIALKKGKYALFEGTGLGKTIQLLEWSKQVVSYTHSKVLIVAPLGVAKQISNTESVKFGIKTCFVNDDSNINGSNIYVTNYEKLEKINTDVFTGVVLDESSILKSFSGKIRNLIVERFKNTSFKLSCSATPAPNDYEELGNQCEFLDIMTRAEMLATYFTHDGGDTGKWMLKPHGKRDFWSFISQWSVFINNPSDIGFTQVGYDLPKINYINHVVNTPIPKKEGLLFNFDAEGLSEQREVRNLSLEDRCKIAAKIINEDNNQNQFLIWCETNAESALLKKLISNAIEVKGSDTDKHKEESALKFASGEIQILITKPSIFGYGMNWQQCHNCIYVGLTHSFESFYQSIRRLYRFGQTKNINCHIIQHELEGNIIRNLKRKELQVHQMFEEMRSVIYTPQSRFEYKNKEIILPDWLTTVTE